MKRIIALFIMGLAFTSLGFAQIQWGDAVRDETNSVEMVASHDLFPFGSRIRVTNLANGKSVVVTVTNRVPNQEKEKVILKIAGSAAVELDMAKAVMTPVFVEAFRDRGAQAVKSGSTVSTARNLTDEDADSEDWY
jgi:rare lipoprotein A